MRELFLKVVSKFPGATMFMGMVRSLLYKFLGIKYNMYGLITDKNCDFMKDPQFIKGYCAAMRQLQDTTKLPSAWNIHVIQWAAFHAKQLDGDFVECGVNRGTNAMSIITYTAFKSLENRKFYLFDTFCGLDPEFCSEQEYIAYKDSYPNCYDFVVHSFKEYPNVMIVKGTVPKTLSQVDIKKVAYLSLDMNCVLPEVEALKFFWPKLEAGAIVVLDDYGWQGHENQKRAMDDFASFMGVKVLSLPNGQGIIIKPLTRNTLVGNEKI